MKSVLVPLVLSLLLIGCEDRQTAPYQGGLYFAQGAYIMRFSLQDGSLSVTGHLGDTVVRDISPLGQELLIAESASVNRRRVPRISWFDPGTGETADLFAGVLARHLSGPGMVVYDDGSHLYAVPQQSERPNQTIFSHGPNQVTGLLAAGQNLLLFEAEEAGERLIRSWDARSGQQVKLEALSGACRLDGAVWIVQLERLLCKRRSGRSAEAVYVFADLDGVVHSELNLPSENEFRALTYIAGQEALVLQEIWQSMLDSRDKFGVWLYDVRTGESRRVAENVNLGDSVVFADY